MKEFAFDTVVVGSGCAGLNAIDTLDSYGRASIALVTEGFNKGTSRNTGSDKQTYYKLALCADERDSIADLADTLSSGGAVDYEVALAEAASSVRCFMKLVQLGVDFPTDRYGQFVGYKTDHDPLQRATSAGPLTSRYMCEALERQVRSKNLTVLDDHTVVQLVTEGNRVMGFVAMHADEPVYVRCHHLLWCTGGPAGIYEDVVYPESQRGMSGLPLLAGCKAVNLQHWQYGIASTAFRWNLSGTYQQVLPSYVSVDEEGTKREFLFGAGLPDDEVLSRMFLKGYQWPFDSKKLDGSSWVDRMVYEESVVKGRRVYLDYRTDPSPLLPDFSNIGKEAYEYLEKSGALFGTPIERLAKMNPLAIDLYRSHGIDLHTQMLEIRVCAQNHNGGLLVDSDWKTNLDNLYACGEVAGTFGPYRPGGSALNSTQVGSLRAVQHIVFNYEEKGFPPLDAAQREAVARFEALAERLGTREDGEDVASIASYVRKQMSRVAAFCRDLEGMEQLESVVSRRLDDFFDTVKADPGRPLSDVFAVQDLLATAKAVLQAMIMGARLQGSLGGAMTFDNGTLLPPRDNGTDGRIVTTLGHSAFEPMERKAIGQSWFERDWEEHRTKRTVRKKK
jgi:succinate dehydrogenase/fumarate reductase flavoprotein subunit